MNIFFMWGRCSFNRQNIQSLIIVYGSYLEYSLISKSPDIYFKKYSNNKDRAAVHTVIDPAGHSAAPCDNLWTI